MARLGPLVAAMSLVVAACYGGGGFAPGASPEASSPAELASPGVIEAPALPALPVDSSLAPISRSAPGADAARVLDLCVPGGDLSLVAGAAQLSTTHDVGKYLPTYGTEPELQADRPVWVVQLRGVVQYRFGVIPNPACVVIDGTPTVYAPYGAQGRTPGGPVVFVSPPPGFVPATLALPPLVP